MRDGDAELDLIRQGVSCAAVLEHQAPAWLLDRRGSTRRALKYRRGDGEIIVVNHDSRGWWDTQSSAKGDVFDLVQFLDPSLTFGQVCRALRAFIGLTPVFAEALHRPAREAPVRMPVERWAARGQLRPGTSAWAYLLEARCLPAGVLAAAARQDAIRDGSFGSGWFAHRNAAGLVSHVECRGPEYKGSLSGGTKTLFRFRSGAGDPCRLVLAEAPIDALSAAALEGVRGDTLYAATGGGMGPSTEAAIGAALQAMSTVPGAVLCSATDANGPGERYADRHAAMAGAAGVAFERLRPTMGADWNDVLRRRR